MPVISSPFDLLVFLAVPALFVLAVIWVVRATGAWFAPDHRKR